MNALREENTLIMEKLDAIITGQAPTVRRRILDILKKQDTQRLQQYQQEWKASQRVVKRTLGISMVLLGFIGILWMRVDNETMHSVFPVWHDNTLIVAGCLVGYLAFFCVNVLVFGN